MRRVFRAHGRLVCGIIGLQRAVFVTRRLLCIYLCVYIYLCSCISGRMALGFKLSFDCGQAFVLPACSVSCFFQRFLELHRSRFGRAACRCSFGMRLGLLFELRPQCLFSQLPVCIGLRFHLCDGRFRLLERGLLRL